MSTKGFILNDGGRAAAGFRNKATAGDCVARAIAIASGRPYREIYDALAHGNATQRSTKHSRGLSGRRTASNGIFTQRKWFKDYMRSLGFVWVPTMSIGSGCTVHLIASELPAGRLVCMLSKHATAMINGVVHDAFDPRRPMIETRPGDPIEHHIETRCVYGYWRLADA